MSMAGCVRFHPAHCAHESACESLAAIPSPLHITRADGVAMELSDIDLNLLVLFQQLMVERRVSKVADNLGLTQPAVSNALAKMRRIFGDELFLRTSGGMVPTPFAEQLGEDMEAGKVDLAIGLLPQLKAGFFQRRLFRQRYVCLFRKGHALDRPKLLLSDYKAAEHLVIVSAGTGHGKVDELIQKAGIDRLVRLSVPHFVSVGHILQSTALVATVPERLALKLVEPFGLVLRTHPVKLPDAPISVFWHAKVHREPVNQWLRSMVFELFGGDGPAGGDLP